MKKKNNDKFIFFELDVSLLCTNYLAPLGMTESGQLVPVIDWDIIKNMIEASKLISKALKKGQVFIDTNTVSGWVEYRRKFYPLANKLLGKN